MTDVFKLLDEVTDTENVPMQYDNENFETSDAGNDHNEQEETNSDYSKEVDIAQKKR